MISTNEEPNISNYQRFDVNIRPNFDDDGYGTGASKYIFINKINK